jgi:hypothetical protein
MNEPPDADRRVMELMVSGRPILRRSCWLPPRNLGYFATAYRTCVAYGEL